MTKTQQPELPALSDDQERAEFELAFPDCDFRRDATGDYAQLRIRCAWIGWRRKAAVLADRESRDQTNSVTQFWADNRSRILDAIDRAGFVLMSNQYGFHLRSKPAQVIAFTNQPKVEDRNG